MGVGVAKKSQLIDTVPFEKIHSAVRVRSRGLKTINHTPTSAGQLNYDRLAYAGTVKENAQLTFASESAASLFRILHWAVEC